MMKLLLPLVVVALPMLAGAMDITGYSDGGCSVSPVTSFSVGPGECVDLQPAGSVGFTEPACKIETFADVGCRTMATAELGAKANSCLNNPEKILSARWLQSPC